jgi:hypothetical protein
MIHLLNTARALGPATALAALLTLGATGISYADPAETAAPPQNEAAAEVSDGKLRQFVEAATEVQTVQQEYAGAIQATNEPDKAKSLQQEAQDKMVKAVEDSGLSVSEYNLIAQRLQQDPSLTNRLNDLQQN